MKKILFAMALSLAALCASAQSTKVVTGAVIDKNGNPLPSALVEATNGAESVTTDADGTFSLEVPIWLKSLTASYAGLQSKKANIRNRNNVVFELKPRTGVWFVDVAYGYSIDGWEDDYEDSRIQYSRVGIMAGYLGNWGGYAKVLMPVGLEDDYESFYLPNITVGVIKQVAKPAYLYLGAGIGANYSGWDHYYYDYDEYLSPAFEAGAIFRFNHLNFSVGYAITPIEAVGHTINASVGYCF